MMVTTVLSKIGYSLQVTQMFRSSVL